MADAPAQPNQFNLNLPTRTITITGESSARMVQNTVRISRLEQRSIQLAMATPAIRDAGRRAMDRLHAAQNAFELELANVEKEIEATNRSNSQRRPARAQRPTLSRSTQQGGDAANAKAAAMTEAASGNTAGKPQQSQKPQKNAGKGGKGGQQAREGQAQSSAKPAVGTAQPAHKEASAQQAAKTHPTAQQAAKTHAVEQQPPSSNAQAAPAASAGLQSL